MSRPLFLRKLRKYVAALPALAFGFMANPAFSTIVTIDASGVTTGASSASFLGATLTSTDGKLHEDDHRRHQAEHRDRRQRGIRRERNRHLRGEDHAQLRRDRGHHQRDHPRTALPQRRLGQRDRRSGAASNQRRNRLRERHHRGLHSLLRGGLARLDRRRRDTVPGHGGQRRHLQDHEPLRLGADQLDRHSNRGRSSARAPPTRTSGW